MHDIVMTRWRIRPRTNDYIQRRRPQGKTDRVRSADASLDDYGDAGQVGPFVGSGEGGPRCLATGWPV